MLMGQVCVVFIKTYRGGKKRESHSCKLFKSSKIMSFFYVSKVAAAMSLNRKTDEGDTEVHKKTTIGLNPLQPRHGKETR